MAEFVSHDMAPVSACQGDFHVWLVCEIQMVRIGYVVGGVSWLKIHWSIDGSVLDVSLVARHRGRHHVRKHSKRKKKKSSVSTQHKPTPNRRKIFQLWIIFFSILHNPDPLFLSTPLHIVC